MLPDQEKYAISVPPASETGSSDDEGNVSEDSAEDDTSSEVYGDDGLRGSDSDSAESKDGKTQTLFLGLSAPALIISAIIVSGAAVGAVYYVKFKRKK